MYRVAHNPYAIAYNSASLPHNHNSGGSGGSGGKGKGKTPADSVNNDVGQDLELLNAAVLPRLPSAGWRASFQRKFRNARCAMALPRAESIHRAVPLPPQGDLNEGVWFQWIFGYGMRARRNQLNKKQSSSGAGAAAVLGGVEEGKKREPSTEMLSALSQVRLSRRPACE